MTDIIVFIKYKDLIAFIFNTKSVNKFHNNTVKADFNLLVKHFCYFIFLSFITKF